MADNTARTKEAIDTWESQTMKQIRVEEFRQLCDEAGLKIPLGALPAIHIEVMNYDKYTMNILALAKIKELRQIANNGGYRVKA